MPTTKRLRAPLFAMAGAVLAVVALAGPATANDTGAYPPPAGTEVIGNGGTPPVVVAGASQTAGDLAFTGTNALAVSGIGGALLVGGAAMVVAGRRRKVNA
jgi:hypothetical protein